MRTLFILAFCLVVSACAVPQFGNNSGGGGSHDQDAPTS